ncbi:hypothetical protein SORDD14_00580 [Streptococcus oralis]|uniref:Uncharacterized protein n=1 Tax=Streptococcus oralis TaxID=1303 RepID=A0A139NYP9_STROR|nr:hypothetical protein SORDD15_00884 [Streptococcus oralis]KXT83210.1 hypothetical protein SORDD14_00580 [Streptococcus oralis]
MRFSDFKDFLTSLFLQIFLNLEKEMKAFDRFSKKVYNKSSNIEGEVSWQLKIS